MSDIIRRDPRQEHIQRNRLHPLHQSLQTQAIVRGPSGLIRKDPRAIGFIGPNGIKRIDRLSGNNVTSGRRSQAKTSVLDERPLIQVENPDFFIAVVLDLVGGRLSSHDKDVLGQAHQLVQSNEAKGAVLAILFAGDESDIKEQNFDDAGVDRLIKICDAAYQGYSPENKVAALQTIQGAVNPLHWLFPDSMAGGNELGCRFAAKINTRLATQVWKVQGDNITCRADSGLSDVVRPLTKVMLMAEECAEPIDETRHQVQVMELEKPPEFIPRIQDLGSVAVDPSQIALAEAEFILSAGNGIHHWEQFHRAAECLGATEGASRVAVDDGFMPRDRQVGATGTWVSARVYIAVGISGAIQHLQGIAQCEKVIAINTDAGCDMVKRADLSVIDDSEKVLQALMDLVNEANPEVSNHVA